MKYFLLVFFCFGAINTNAQKYILLDEHLSQPVTYSNKVTSTDNFNDLFPVEKKYFLNLLKHLKKLWQSFLQKGIWVKRNNMKWVAQNLQD